MWKIDGFFDAFNSLHEIIEFLSHQSVRTIWMFSDTTISYKGTPLFWILVYVHDDFVMWSYKFIKTNAKTRVFPPEAKP